MANDYDSFRVSVEDENAALTATEDEGSFGAAAKLDFR